MIKAFLVDLDGTLVETKLANLAAYKQAFSTLGIVNDEEALNKWVGILPWDQMLSKVLPPSEIHKKSEVASLKREIYPQYFYMVRVNEALVDLLKFSKSKSMLALVTSASRNSAIPLLEHLQLLEYFNLTVTSDDCEFRKPHPAPYILAAHQLKVKPKECLVFEDSDIGMQAAQAFGANALRIRW